MVPVKACLEEGLLSARLPEKELPLGRAAWTAAAGLDGQDSMTPVLESMGAFVHRSGEERRYNWPPVRGNSRTGAQSVRGTRLLL